MAESVSSALKNRIIKILTESNVPMSSEEVTVKLQDYQMVYSVRHIKRILNELRSAGTIELVGRRVKVELFSIPGKQLDPWESTKTAPTVLPTIKLYDNRNYSPDQLARALYLGDWSALLNDTANRELSAMLSMMVLGSAGHTTLQAHSLLPVRDIRQPLETFRQRLSILLSIIDTVLGNELVKTAASGDYISDATRDMILSELEEWLQRKSINKRANINGD